MKNTNITQEFIDQAILRFEENAPRIEKCLNELTEEEVWKRPNDSSNSIGNLIIHLCGNISQYIISSLGEKEDNRDRDAEFSIREGYSKKQLMEMLHNVEKQSVNIIKSISEESLLKVRSVQGFEFSGIGIIIHVVEHYSYHTGQIAFWTKLLKDKDLGFYAGQDLNQKNAN